MCGCARTWHRGRSFSESLTNAGLLPQRVQRGLGGSSGEGAGEGGTRAASLGEVLPGGTCRPGEAVGSGTLRMYSECSGGELPGPRLVLPGPSPADQQIGSQRQLGLWLSGAAVAGRAELIYHPAPRRLNHPESFEFYPALSHKS